MKTYVICPGFIYGCGENFFFDYFRMSWIENLQYVPIIGNGLNFLPTIHILDLVQIIRRVIERKPDFYYIFACDKTKEPTMKNIIKTIVNNACGLEIKILKDNFNVDCVNIPNYTELSIDLRIKQSPLFIDEKKKLREDTEEYNKRIFKWHCEYGIPENITKLQKEFNIYRNLKRAKILIHGPPSSGKTTIAKLIAKKYKLPYLSIDQVCKKAENLNSPLGEEIKQKLLEIEENIAKALDEYEHRKNKRRTDPPLDTSQIKKFSSEFLSKILKEKLKNGECLSKGFIIDNYPKTYEDCFNLFTIMNYNENKEKNIDKSFYINNLEKTILPDSVIIINNYTEESLKSKLQKIPDYTEKQFDIDNRFNRRLATYKKNMEITEDNKKNIEDFYKENDIKIHYVDEKNFMENKNDEEKKIIDYLERNGPIDDYSNLFDENEDIMIPYIEIPEKENPENNENDINNNVLNENNQNLLMENNNKNEIIKEANENLNGNEYNKLNSKKSMNKNNLDILESINENKENETNEIKISEGDKKINDVLDYNNAANKGDVKRGSIDLSLNNINNLNIQEKILQEKLNALKERERNFLEKKSEVIRRYLSENVMPLLAKGILTVCETMPDDPVEALANFLLDNSFDFQKDILNNNSKDNNEEEQ